MLDSQFASSTMIVLCEGRVSTVGPGGKHRAGVKASQLCNQ
eukprot:CAMPEP_0180524464 /NCGR_PEP_ID=MMETSP1036_2-20121128/58639_1 /TAXON_ID=632150 /ORGANISM="Azadinium spinosum, Strain 3D9" /LENGTH=40 /DNA_ID= /DNA_START= /DNA_END= /DNA_ORIENTATION=